jgi:toxin ParE1/3/4
MTIRFRPRATADVYDLMDAIGEYHPRSAEAFATRVQEACRLLERFPLLGSIAPAAELAEIGLRVYRLKRFRNHLVLYLPLSDGIEVVRVIDGRRDLGRLFDESG